MQLRSLFVEDRAVAPVIATILLVAVVVILAATLGSYVFGLAQEQSNVAPKAEFDFDYNRTAAGDYRVNATYESGEIIDRDNTLYLNLSTANGNTSEYDLPVNPGESKVVVAEPDTEVWVVWTSPDEKRTAFLAKTKTPA